MVARRPDRRTWSTRYTTTNRYPYAQRADTDDARRRAAASTGAFNYVRNSVKAVVDAYDGTVTLYVVDDEDPIIQAYRKAFPELFTDRRRDARRSCEEHFRYPEDLFRVQTNMWGRYHVDDPDDFYNADRRVGRRPGPGQRPAPSRRHATTTTTSRRASPTPVERPDRPVLPAACGCPGEEDESFLHAAAVRAGVRRTTAREQLTAFMVAKSDPEDYGELEIVRRCRRADLPDGPQDRGRRRCSSNAEVSEQHDAALPAGLASAGSATCCVIPIEQSLLYVRPLYVAAEATGRCRSCGEVIVAFQRDADAGTLSVQIARHARGRRSSELLRARRPDDRGATGRAAGRADPRTRGRRPTTDEPSCVAASELDRRSTRPYDEALRGRRPRRRGQAARGREDEYDEYRELSRSPSVDGGDGVGRTDGGTDRPRPPPTAAADHHADHRARRGLSAGWRPPEAAAMVDPHAAGWSSLVARRAHNPKVAGSNPAPATN